MPRLSIVQWMTWLLSFVCIVYIHQTSAVATVTPDADVGSISSLDGLYPARPSRRSRLLQPDAVLHKLGRRLFQQQVRVQVPQCLWSDVREVCTPGQLAYLAVKAKPVSLYHRVTTEAYDRNIVCNGHPTESLCNKDRSNRCMYWNKSCVGMDAFELVNWLGEVTGDATAAGFTCKGTEAQALRECRTATEAGPQGLCSQLPGCKYRSVTDECLPAAFDLKTLKQVDSVKAAFNTFNTSVWGTCSGSCYVRQALVCSQARDSSAACTKKAYCVWDVDPFDRVAMCMHKDTAALGSDEFSKEYLKIKDACVSAKTQAACEQMKVIPVNVGSFLRSTDMQNLTAGSGVACIL